jgi:hypothetical protein
MHCLLLLSDFDQKQNARTILVKTWNLQKKKNLSRVEVAPGEGWKDENSLFSELLCESV